MMAIDGPAAEGRLAGRGEGDGGRPRVHVGGRGGVVAVQDLGREIARRPEQPAGVGQLRVVGDPGQAEVDEDRRPALHQHVRGLHVAMQHADRVHRRDALGEAGREPGQVLAFDRPLLVHVVVQRETRDVAGGDVRHRRPRVGVDDLGDPLAPDPAQRPHLALQPASRLVVADDVRPEHLERHPRARRRGAPGAPRPCRPRRSWSAGCSRPRSPESCGAAAGTAGVPLAGVRGVLVTLIRLNGGRTGFPGDEPRHLTGARRAASSYQ